MGVKRHRSPVGRALLALAAANARYWPTVAPTARAQLRGWRAQAQRIDDPELRALALAKLQVEGMNAQAAAIAATLAPSAHRAAATRAIVALELLFDYLDGLTERPLPDPLADAARLYGVLTGAFVPAAQAAGSPDASQSGERQGAGVRLACNQPAQIGDAQDYLNGLAATVREELAELPARGAVIAVAHECALSSAQAQARLHAVPALGLGQLTEWAREQARGGPLGWREHAAGAAASVLTLHALIAAAADPATTAAQARRIAAAYLSICALATLLDGVVDGPADSAAGRVSYASLYGDEALLADALARVARVGIHACAELRGGEHHLMMLAGVVAYWCSTPGAQDALSAPVYAPLRAELGALPFASLLVMRAWRAGRRLR